MKRVTTLIAATGALMVFGAAFTGVASAATKPSAPGVSSPSSPFAIDKGRHDICVGTLDPNGVQHPWFCINLPQTAKAAHTK